MKAVVILVLIVSFLAYGSQHRYDHTTVHGFDVLHWNNCASNRNDIQDGWSCKEYRSLEANHKITYDRHDLHYKIVKR